MFYVFDNAITIQRINLHLSVLLVIDTCKGAKLNYVCNNYILNTLSSTNCASSDATINGNSFQIGVVLNGYHFINGPICLPGIPVNIGNLTHAIIFASNGAAEFIVQSFLSCGPWNSKEPVTGMLGLKDVRKINS